jgi:hypothetical protein
MRLKSNIETGQLTILDISVSAHTLYLFNAPFRIGYKTSMLLVPGVRNPAERRLNRLNDPHFPTAHGIDGSPFSGAISLDSYNTDMACQSLASAIVRNITPCTTSVKAA